MPDTPVDVTKLERIKLESPHTDFDTYLIAGDDSKPAILRVRNVPEVEQPAGPPPAPVWNVATGVWELPSA